ncbi:MAG: glycoside hydrolase family 88/105 protein, partial [Bacteroidota bacterium]
SLTCCGNTGNDARSVSPESWATRLADGVMYRADSLVYYLRDKPKYEYDYSFLAYAIGKLGDRDPKYAAYARAYIDYFVKDDGSIGGYKLSDYNIDRVRPGVNILELYKQTGEEKYLKAAQTLRSQMETHPRTQSKGYWHKKVYPWQMWLDGLFMAEPFLAEYATEFDQPQMFDDITFQFRLIYEKTLDPATGLLYHGWDESRQQRWCNTETGQSQNFWGRAMGWYVMAITDVLDFLPEDHPDRPELISILNRTCEALLKVQDPATGLWYQVLDKGGMEGNYLEASGSAMFIYTFAKAAGKGYLPERYMEIASSAFDNMVKTLVKEGEDGYPVLINTCGGAGLGGEPDYRMGDYDYYIHEKRVDNDTKGLAPLILAAIELGK